MNRIMFLLLIVSINSYAQDTGFNWMDDGIFDEVKKITEEEFIYSNNQKKLETTRVFYYDKIGMGIKTITYHHNDENLHTSYSAYGNHIDLYGTYLDSSTYFYDDNNQLLEKQHFDPTGVILKDYYTHTNFFTIVKSEQCYNGFCITTSVDFYASSTYNNLSLDNVGGVHEFIYSNQTENDSVLELIHSSYYDSQYIRIDKKRKTGITKSYLGADTARLEEYCINYYDDSLKHLLRQRVFGPDKKTLLKECFNTYKGGDLIEEKILNEEGNVIYATLYSKNATIDIRLNDNGEYDTTLSKKVQVSDEHGNWINEKYFDNGEIVSETIRVIEYYKENDDEGYKYIYEDEMLPSSYKWQSNDSLYKKLNIKQGQLQLLVKFDDYSKVYIYLINKTNDTVRYTTQNGKIPMIREAINENGEWQPIEYWEWSFCGNSFSSQIIPPGKELYMSTFIYGGTMKTKIRFKMRLKKNCILYSDSYDGRVNKNQFIKPKITTERDFLDN